MAEPAKAKDRATRVVAIASGQDPKRLRLSAAEGYLLSRIDGRTPWRLLREIGGIPAADVDACLERWLEAGLVELVGGAGDPSKAKAAEAKASGSASHSKPAAAATSRVSGSARTPDAASAATQARPLAMDAASVPTPLRPSRPIDSSLLDPGLDIDGDVQRRILEFEASLDRPYHELLGVAVGADPKTVKRAYFKLSKEFHPDRYFRRRIGPYQQRLERIFKKVLEAHEILSDPELCQVENQSEAISEIVAEAVDPAVGGTTAVPGGQDGIPAQGAVTAQAGQSASSANSASAALAGTAAAANATRASATDPSATTVGSAGSEMPAAPRALTKLERLKQRMPFKIDGSAMAARRARALEIFRAAEASLSAGRLQEAESGIRIAITFDPARAEFKEALGALRIRAAGDRAMKLLAAPSERMSDGELREALQLIEEVLPYRPHDPELNLRAAHVCLQLGRHAEALEFVETLLDSAPDVASHHSLRGRIERERGDLAAAQRAYQRALELDREDLEARRALASMRIAAHDAARGGRR